MLKFLHIITAATPRKEIHDLGLIPFIQSLETLPHLRVRWLVNMDCIPYYFTKQEIMDSIKNIKRNVPANVELHFFEKHENFGFSKAGRDLFTYCADTLPQGEHIFMWLEDDWCIENPDQAKKNILTFMRNPQFEYCGAKVFAYGIRDYSRQLRVTGAPNLFRESLFRGYLEVTEQKPIDPELALQKAGEIIWDQSLNEERHRRAQEWTDAGQTPPRKWWRWWVAPPRDKLLIAHPPTQCRDLGVDWRKERDIQKTNSFERKFNTGWIQE